jgi:hypothetical protein
MRELPIIPKYQISWYSDKGSIVVAVTSNEHVRRYVVNQLREVNARFDVIDQTTFQVVEYGGDK